jgi:hypothetical protein
MSERFSIKGKGAELFFGDDERREPQQRPKPELPEVPATHAASGPASPPAAQPPGQQATLPPSAQDTRDASAQLSEADAATRHRLRELLAQDHPLHYSYRFTREEIDALRDIVYELEAKRGLRITRNDVVRFGLNWAIDDYRAHGKESLLMQVMKEERWTPEP